MKKISRGEFVNTSATAGLGFGLAGSVSSVYRNNIIAEGKRIGIIGLDGSHAVAFTKVFNDPAASPEYLGYKVVAAYPKGSNGGGRSTKSESVNLCVRFLIVI